MGLKWTMDCVLIVNIRVLWLLSAVLVRKCGAVCSPIYGQPPCNTFLPAPPGHAPSCARPGYTYCEHPNNYPGQLIQHLVEKWRVDHKTLIMDESQYDFNAYFVPSQEPKPSISPPVTSSNRPVYGPIVENQRDQDKLPEPIYIPKPSYTVNLEGGSGESKTYIPPPPPPLHLNYSGEFPDYSSYYNRPQDNVPANQIDYNTIKFMNQPYQFHQNYYTAIGQPHITREDTEFWKRYNQQQQHFYNNQLRTKRSLRLLRSRRFLQEKGFFNNGTRVDKGIRAKRQQTGGGAKLCETRTRYVMPRAAANKEGQWFYLVNIPGYTQQVNTETCVSQQCNGLCSLPAGYASRCEQKYVQKRLVALEGSGNNLMNDLFWFPVCCVCTLSN